MKRDYNRVEAIVLTEHYGWHEVNCEIHPIRIHFDDICTYLKYDDKGRVIFEECNDVIRTWEYDDENNRVHSKSNDDDYEYWEFYDDTNRITYHQNSYGLIKHYAYFENGGWYCVEYSDNATYCEIKMFDSNNYIITHTTPYNEIQYTYDNDYKLICLKIIWPNGDIEETIHEEGKFVEPVKIKMMRK